MHFIRAFLLESNATAVRWQAHALLLSFYRCALPEQQVANDDIRRRSAHPPDTCINCITVVLLHLSFTVTALAFVVKRRSNFPRSSFVHDYQEMILEMIWGLWSELPAHGRKAAQFVDLLGYFSLKHSEPRPADEGANDEGR